MLSDDMKTFLIIKTGDTMPSLRACRGDFEDWILSGMGLSQSDALITDVARGDALPNPDGLSGIAIAGSHDMVTDGYDWIGKTAEWLNKAADLRIPTLGICFGHQLLAHALGGTVGDNPNGREFGTVEVHLTDSAADDPLFCGLPTDIRVHVCHTQTVLSLPPAAQVLAFNDMDGCHAFVYGEHVWGIQFHPEFDADVTRAYIQEHRQELEAEGQDPDQLINTCIDTPFGGRLLRRFAGIVGKI